MADTEDFTIEVQVDGVPGVEAPETATDGGSDNKAVSNEDALADLRRQLEESAKDAQQARDALAESERRRRDSDNHAMEGRRLAESARVSVDAANYDAISNSLTAAKGELETLQSQLERAMADGDYKSASSIQGKMSIVGGKIVTLETGKAELDERRKAQPDQSQRQNQSQQRQISWDSPWSQDDFETVLRDRTPQTAAWMRSHPQVASDMNFRRQLTAAHNYAVAKGLVPDTAEYFKMVEDTISPKTPGTEQRQQDSKSQVERTRDAQDRTSSAAASTSRTSPTPAAPVSRTVPGAAASKVAVRLTKEEMDHARATLTPEVIGKNPDGTPRDPLVVFAQHKARLQSEGKYTER